MKKTRKITAIIALAAIILSLSACANTKNPYDDAEKRTFTLDGVSIDVPASMQIDTETSDTALYIEMPDAELAMIKAEVFTHYTVASEFYEDYQTLLQDGGYESLAAGEVTEEKIGGKNVSVLTYTYAIDGVAIDCRCVVWEYTDGIVLFTGVTSPSFDEDITDLMEYLIKYAEA